VPNYEIFTRRSTPTERRLLISIQRNQTLSMNEQAYAALGKPAAVELLFDPAERVMGFRAVDPTAHHAYPVRRNSTGSSYVVAGGAFLKYYDVAEDIRRRYLAEMDGAILAVDLKREPVEIGSGRGMDRQKAEEPAPRNVQDPGALASKRGKAQDRTAGQQQQRQAPSAAGRSRNR
jgi:hypothetical protein